MIFLISILITEKQVHKNCQMYGRTSDLGLNSFLPNERLGLVAGWLWEAVMILANDCR